VLIGVLLAGVSVPRGVFGFDQGTDGSVGPPVAGPVSGRNVVSIDVVVRDHDANPVTGLTREDFRLLQDGKQVAITHFAAFTEDSFGQTAPDSVAPVAGEPVKEERGPAADVQPIYVVVYIDHSNLDRFDRNRVLRALRGFFEESIGGPVRIMVVSYENAIVVAQPFTDSSREVVGALQGLRTVEVSNQERVDEYDRVLREIRKADEDLHRRAVGRGSSTSEIYENIHLVAREEVMHVEKTISALRETVTAMTGIRGRKYLLYVSNGLPMVSGKDLMYEFGEMTKQRVAADQSAQYNQRRSFDALIAAANAQEITIHTIDATGEYSNAAVLGDADAPRSAGSRIIVRDNLQGPLVLMAEKTGGLAVVNSDDFQAGLDRIRTDLQTYYSIGYDMETTSSDTVHHIEVQLTEGDYETRYRRTVVEKSLRSRVQDEVTSALYFDVGENPMDIKVLVDAQIKATETQWVQPLTVRIPAASLALREEGGELVADAVVFVALRNLDATSTDVQRNAHEFRMPGDGSEDRASKFFEVPVRLVVEQGSHSIVVGVLDEGNGHTAYEKMNISCPSP